MMSLELGLSSSTAASAASGQGDMNVVGGGGGKLAWLPWVIIGVVVIAALVIFRPKRKG